MEQRSKFNEDSDMWGFQEMESPENVKYMGEPLLGRFKRDELWLRSDLSRLLELFKVGIPANVALE